MMEVDFKKVTESRLGTKSRVVVVDLRGAGAEGDDENAEFTPDNETFQPLGLVSRPVLSSTLEALVIRFGDQDIVLCMSDKGQARLTDLEEGETRLYGAKEVGAVLRIRADGSIEITPAAGQDIVLAGGTKKVARTGDTTSGHTHTATFALAAGATPVTGTITIASATDTIQTGASHIKG